MSYGYAGSEWIEESLGLPCSPLGKDVADLLGDVFLGIYHLNTRALRKVDWQNKHYIEFNLDRPLYSVDSNELTRLIVLAHDRMLRIEIRPCNFQNIKLGISKRTSRDGDLYHRCPTIDNHIKQIRDAYGRSNGIEQP